ncbi:hypothetical protein AX16_001136 [Volvariella volvacea WC 439]|nr:hypothetical protein AX16_001136 [Volvariella volvacea WC 439]
MALSFIGKPISLISHSDVRYRGILAGIDPQASTIQLSNVYSMGTESRRPASEFIPPVQEPYQYIIFRASEVKDLAVDEPTPRRSVHDDPAVLGASAPMPAGYSPYMNPPNGPMPHQPPPQGYAPRPQQVPPGPPPAAQPPPPAPQQGQPSPAPAQPSPQQPPQQSQQSQPQQQQQQQQRPPQNRRNNNSVQNAAASLETVERAIGDLRISNQQANQTNGHPGHHGGHNNHHGGGRGGRRGGAPKHEQMKVPTTDFDFASSNAKFDKASVAQSVAGSTATSAANAGQGQGQNEEAKEGEEGQDNDKSEKDLTPAAYNPQKSFFDSLSSSALPAPSGRGGSGGGGGGGRGGRGGGRNRREEEREKNISTFGEPGGVGLMGPGAYVGGYGRRGGGGGRPRRGGPPGGHTSGGVNVSSSGAVAAGSR